MAKVDDWVEELCASLGRACDVFHSPLVHEEEHGQQVFFRTREALQPRVAECVKVYVRRFCRSNGLAMKKLSLKRGHIQIDVRPASPKRRRAP